MKRSRTVSGWLSQGRMTRGQELPSAQPPAEARARRRWGKKWGKKPHRSQPIPADPDLAKTA
jgi:hypothetical protein